MLWAGRDQSQCPQRSWLPDRARLVILQTLVRDPFASFASSLVGAGLQCLDSLRPRLRDGGHRDPAGRAGGTACHAVQECPRQKPAQPGLCLVKALCPPSGLREAPLLAKGAVGEFPA